MHEEDRTGSTGPSGSHLFSTKTGAADATARATKPAGDYVVTTVDRGIAARVRSALSGDSTLLVSDENVHIKVDNGQVILHARVNSEREKEMISDRIREIEGVRALDNQLAIVSGGHSFGSGR
jgi:osmotically-inducible protein OsmY